MWELILFSLYSSLLIGVSSETGLDIKPCKLSDSACIDNNCQNIYLATVLGNPELRIEHSAPMYQEKVEGKLSTLSYTLTNSTVIGFERCKIGNCKFSRETLNFKFTMKCPDLSMAGVYVIDGRLLILPIQGNGDYTITVGEFLIDIDATIVLTTGKDAKKYMSLKNIHFNADIIGRMNFDLKNLFNGQQDLAEPVLKFMNENWKEVGSELQGPALSANLKKLVKNFNKYLKSIPLEKFITV